MTHPKHDDQPTGDELPEQPSHGLHLPDDAGREENGAIGAVEYNDDEHEGDVG